MVAIDRNQRVRGIFPANVINEEGAPLLQPERRTKI